MRSYVAHTQGQRAQMLRDMGISSIDELFKQIPKEFQLKKELSLPSGMDEVTLSREIAALANKNISSYPIFLGAGCYRHYLPSVVKHMVSREEFFTAYTPYQAEMSQGMLQAIFEYQTLMCELTGLDASNASVYDGATATAEAMSMCVQATRRSRFLVIGNIHPQTLQTLLTYAACQGVNIDVCQTQDGTCDLEHLQQLCTADTAGVYVQQPNFWGCLEDMQMIEQITHQAGALLVAGVNPISLGLLATPGEFGTDIAVGEGQPLGNPMNFGGPGFGFMTTQQKWMRRLPGRIVGQTVDTEGNRAFVLTLQAREQHIRREKAASNICSNQALNALAAAVYLSAMGKQGMRQVAELCYHKAHYAKEQISKIKGQRIKFECDFFNEFVVESDINPNEIQKQLRKVGIIGGLPLSNMQNCTLYCVTEMSTKADIDALCAGLEGLQ